MLKNTKSNQSGFTLVELLIVIVVIAILAVISIVAYNGVQNRAKTSAAATAAETVQKKAEAANAIAASYPQTEADFTAQDDSDLTGSGIIFQTAAFGTTAPNSPATVIYTPCTGTEGTGAVITYWDYSENTSVTKSIGQPTASGTCAAASAFAVDWQ